MKKIKKIEKKEGADYIINKDGEVVEILKVVNVVDKIPVRERHHYFVDASGNIIEMEVLDLTQKEYDKLSKEGKIKELLSKGVKINIIPDEDATLAEMEEIDARNLELAVLGARIVEVAVIRKKDGSREMHMRLDNGKTLKLKEGLLLKGSEIELE